MLTVMGFLAGYFFEYLLAPLALLANKRAARIRNWRRKRLCLPRLIIFFRVFASMTAHKLCGAEIRVSVMRNHIDLDHKHCRAITLELGERRGLLLPVEPEFPASFETQIERLHSVV